VLQNEGGVPIGGVFVLLFVAVTSIEFFANPGRDPDLVVVGPRPGFFFLFGLIRGPDRVLVPGQEGGLPRAQVLVGEEFLLLLPVPGV